MLSSIPVIVPHAPSYALYASLSPRRLQLSAISPPFSDTSPQAKIPCTAVRLLNPSSRTYPRGLGRFQPIPPGRVWREFGQWQQRQCRYSTATFPRWCKHSSVWRRSPPMKEQRQGLHPRNRMHFLAPLNLLLYRPGRGVQYDVYGGVFDHALCLDFGDAEGVTDC